jgi:cell division septation protein DedD
MDFSQLIPDLSGPEIQAFAAGFPVTLAHVGITVFLLFLGSTLYVWLTPYKEIALIREGNAAAAVALGGVLLGLAVPPPPATATEGTIVTTQETLTYPERLEEANPPAETLKARAVARTTTETLPEPEAEPIVGSAPAPVPAATTANMEKPEPAGNGFVVQVAAVRQRAEADTIARRLSAKGYPAFVTTPAGAANVFRVRIGKYTDRREAESIAGKLEKEEQFKPWITR